MSVDAWLSLEFSACQWMELHSETMDGVALATYRNGAWNL